MPSVSRVLGRWTEMKSASASTCASGHIRTPIRPARSSPTNGSKARTRIPNDAARWATSVPIRPRPRIPSVLPYSSTPWNDARSHTPDRSEASAAGIRLAWASSSAMVCSAAEIVLASGVLTTITPA